MRKVVLYALLSADGVAESPDRYVFDWDEAMDANLARVIGTQDAVLLGRRTYDEWAPHWPTADVQPFADFINSVPKYVFTATEPDVPWPGTTVVETPAERFVRNLKTQPGADIGIHGSIQLARTLLAADLVDELQLVISPTLLGVGRKLFADGDPTRRLTLTQVKGTPSGAVLATYGVRT
ncbi:dihydrofolate reductase family protein [Actinoplanes aureus]|uniref:Dihydrofolate reductase n=1 Tax=Actinoplanes aureus TaxID=2792083 RepID=A0A931CCE6_9ACTN|nr:dihydrofolate reductase family protein [Actinoplanes aureus]MBG0565412.1 dihydrofolate reductase [Actinoplanes aureus]